MIRVLIADDEPLARARLRELLVGDEDVSIVGEIGDGRRAVEAIKGMAPDLVLLDVQMPELDGFEVVQAVGAEHMPPVVFVTAYDEFAVRAFDVHAVDYVLKPIGEERFAEALRRAKEHVRVRSDGSDGGGAKSGQAHRQMAAFLAEVTAAATGGVGGGSQRPPAGRLPIRTGGRVLLLQTAAVDWVDAMDNYVRVHVGPDVHIVRETLTRLLQRLPATDFLRVHWSVVINVDRIKETRSVTGSTLVVTLVDGTRITVGRGYRSAVEEYLSRSV